MMIEFDKMDDAIKSISIGDELLNELIMFSLDVPVSKHFYANGKLAEKGPQDN